MTLNPLNIYTALIKNPKTKWVTIILTVLYIASPIDFIPEFIPIAGLLDDGVLISFLVIALKELRPKKSVDAKFR
jgi:uncharacterized membrane protein YkvA (DUF1232 family)